MKILYIHQYFITPDEPGGTRSYWLAQELIRNGHQVTMLTSSIKYQERIKKITIDSIDVIYIKEEYSQSMNIVQRLRAFIGFMLKATYIGWQMKNINLVIATSTPLTIGIPALVLKWTKKIPYIFEVRDLWPEVPIQMGALKNPLVRWVAKFLEKTIYKNSEHVIALSPGMRNGVTKYIPNEKTSMIPNMSKKNEFWPREKNREFETKLGLSPESFKVVHFGSLGLANGVETIIESAKLLKGNNSIVFLFVGGGSTEDELIEECEKNQLINVKFLGKFSMKETSEIVNICDISIVSFKDLPILYTNSPNKLFDSLSAGKPIIVNSAGWTKEMVEKHNCGYYVNPRFPQELVDKLLNLKNNPKLINQMGENSRRLAETVYDKTILSHQFVKLIEEVYRHAI